MYSSRIAVSFFFITSAYFFFRSLAFRNGKITKSKENYAKLKKYWLRLVLLYSVWSLVYLLWSIPSWIETGWFSFKAFVDFGLSAVFNSSYYHLWFLVRLIYVIPLMYLILRHFRVKLFILLAVLIYIIGLFYGGSYTWVGLPFSDNMSSLPYYLSGFRTAIFVVMPICSMSLLVDRIRQWKNHAIYLLTALSMLVYFSESIVLKLFLGNYELLSYVTFSTLPMTLMLLASAFSTSITFKHHFALRKLSTLIYVIHPLVIGGISLIISDSKIDSVLYYLIVALISFVLSLVRFFPLQTKKIKILKYIMRVYGYYNNLFSCFHLHSPITSDMIYRRNQRNDYRGRAGED